MGVASFLNIGAVNEALVYNRNLKAAAARLREARETSIAVRANTLPTVGLSGNVAATERSDTDRTRSHGLNLAASWEPDLWGRLRNLTTAAESEEQAAIEDFRGARLSLASCKDSRNHFSFYALSP